MKKYCIVRQERNFFHTIKRRKANWIGHVLCKNCLLKYSFESMIEVRIEVTEGRGKSRKQLQGDLKKARGFWKLKEDALDHALWRTGFGRGYGSAVRQTAE
jgi:hypothetical protein